MNTTIRDPKPQRANEVWHIELGPIVNSTQQVWVLYVIDLFSRECLTAEVQTGFNGSDIVQVLDRLASQQGAPKYLIADSGQLFSDAAIAGWAADHGTQIVHPHPANPFRKGIVERLFRSLELNGTHNVALAVDAWNLALKDKK